MSNAKVFQEILLFVALVLVLQIQPVVCSCRRSCGGILLKPEFGIDPGCGAPEFSDMFVCLPTDDDGGERLFFVTASGNYPVESMDGSSPTVTVISDTPKSCNKCTQRKFIMTNSQYSAIRPSPNNVIIFLNCPANSSVLDPNNPICSGDFAGHSCSDMYKLFNFSFGISAPSPPCCFTSFDKLPDNMVSECTNFAIFHTRDPVMNAQVGIANWSYGIKLSYITPPACDRCKGPGGICGFQVETRENICICSTALNSTSDCMYHEVTL